MKLQRDVGSYVGQLHRNFISLPMSLMWKTILYLHKPHVLKSARSVPSISLSFFCIYLLYLHHLRLYSCYGRESPCTVYPVWVMAHPKVLFCNYGWLNFSKRYSICVFLVCEVGLPSLEFSLQLALPVTAHTVVLNARHAKHPKYWTARFTRGKIFAFLNSIQ